MVKDYYLIDWVEKIVARGNTICINTNDIEIVSPYIDANEAAMLKEKYLKETGYRGIKVKVINVPLLITINEE